jgi:hypothetical protein
LVICLRPWPRKWDCIIPLTALIILEPGSEVVGPESGRASSLISTKLLVSFLLITKNPNAASIDADSHHADVFMDAVVNAIDGPYKGEWVTNLSEGIADRT